MISDLQLRLEAGINRFGGEGLWQRLNYINLDIQAISGPLPKIKGIGRTFPHFGRVQVFPKQFRAVFFDRAGSLLGEFQAGTIHQEGHGPLSNHRSSFYGLSKHRTWNAQDAMYFFGYALTVYFNIPFLLTSLPVRLRPWKNDGLRVDAVFPSEIHSHCRHQRFYFDGGALLVRHDYTADIVSRFASGAHFTSDYVELGGLLIARQRRVFTRFGGLVLPFPVLSAKIRPVEVGLL